MTCGTKDGIELEEEEEDCGGDVPGSHPALPHPFSPRAIPVSYWVVYRIWRALDDLQVSIILILKFPVISSGDWQVPAAWGHGETPRTLVTLSRHPA